jgi:formamidase
VRSIRIDRQKSLVEEPHSGHNRYHPDIEPLLEVNEGEEITLETRDAVDGQITSQTTIADFPSIDRRRIHPLTGPVFVKGAEPGDLLEIEFLDITPQPTAFTAIFPGGGFLRDVMTEPFLVHWSIDGASATSQQLPGVRIPGAPFMGISAVAPSAQKLAEWAQREHNAYATKAEWRLPPIPPVRYQNTAALPAFGPFRRAKTAETLTSNN